MKIFFGILILQALIVTQTTLVNASSATVVKVEPQTSWATVGQTFNITITVIDVQNLFGLEINLSWNASVLEMVTADVRLGVETRSDGVLHEPFFNQTISEEGRFYIIATSLFENTPSFNGNGNIAKIAFKVIRTGSCILNLESELANKPPPGEEPSPIAHTTIDGFFAPPSPEQPIWPYVAIFALIIVVIAAIVIYRITKKG